MIKDVKYIEYYNTWKVHQLYPAAKVSLADVKTEMTSGMCKSKTEIEYFSKKSKEQGCSMTFVCF